MSWWLRKKFPKFATFPFLRKAKGFPKNLPILCTYPFKHLIIHVSISKMSGEIFALKKYIKNYFISGVLK